MKRLEGVSFLLQTLARLGKYLKSYDRNFTKRFFKGQGVFYTTFYLS